jgi:hypothetical protein
MRRDQDIAAVFHKLRGTRQEALKSLWDGLFDKQIEVVSDRSKRIAIYAGRRAGKTTLLPRLMLHCASVTRSTPDLTPIIGYLVRTKDQARRLIWGRLQNLAKAFNVPILWNATHLTGKHQETGCEIWVLGADDEKDMDKLRGFPYAMIIVDEAQILPGHFERLVREVLSPALADLAGPLVIAGTPNAACAGYFYEACVGDHASRYSVHHWTVRDNPKFPRWAGKPDWEPVVNEFLAEIRHEDGWQENDPGYEREWLGKWVRDGEGLVYRYDEARNTYDGNLPDGDWQYCLGVDIGYNDAFALVEWAYSLDNSSIYQTDEYQKSGLIPAQWAEVIKERMGRHTISKIVMDSGALGKAIAEEFRQRYQIPILPAEKTAKADYIELMNSDYRQGNIKLMRGSQLEDEVMLLPWEPMPKAKREDPKFARQKREDPAYANNLADAHLYAWRECKHWAHEDEKKKPKKDTEEYWEEKEAVMWAALEKPDTSEWWEKE